MVDLFEQRIGHSLNRPEVVRTGTARMEFDAGWLPEDAPGILVEAWAHQGPARAAQRKKIVADAFKLAFAAATLAHRPRLYLLFSDEQAAAPFWGTRAWSAAAFAHFGIERAVVDLPSEERDIIRRAQERQFR